MTFTNSSNNEVFPCRPGRSFLFQYTYQDCFCQADHLATICQLGLPAESRDSPREIEATDGFEEVFATNLAKSGFTSN